MATTERQQFEDGINHVNAIIAAMEQCGPDQEVIVCPICKTFRTVRKGSTCECPTCSRIMGTSNGESK